MPSGSRTAGRPAIRRVLMTADTVGGVWTYALELARTLTRQGIEVGLATMGAPLTRDQVREWTAIPGLSLFESKYRLEWMSDPWSDLARAADWLLTLESEFAPDIVHLNGYVHGDLPWRAPHIVVGHSCVLSWWRAVKGVDAPPEWDRYRSAVTSGVRAADYVVAPTRAMLHELERFYGPLRAAGVAPNGRDPLLYRESVKDSFVLSAGRVWDEAKNLPALAEISGRVEWPICIAGETQHPDGTAITFGDVRLLGKLSPAALASWYARAPIYCMPARYEPFGLSILEAALSRCALVLGDIPSLRENWDGAALFVAPGDTGALANAIHQLIAHAGQRTMLAFNARERARTFTPERMAERYVDIYRQLVMENKPATVTRS